MTTIKIVNRKDELLCQLDGVATDTTVADFKDLVIKDCDYISKCFQMLRNFLREKKTWARKTAIHSEDRGGRCQGCGTLR